MNAVDGLKDGLAGIGRAVLGRKDWRKIAGSRCDAFGKLGRSSPAPLRIFSIHG